MNQRISRRSVLKGSVAVAAAASLHGFTAKSYANVVGANDAVRLGVIGFKGRGMSHIDAFAKMKGVQVVALCDADEAVIPQGTKRLDQILNGGGRPTSRPTRPTTKPVARSESQDAAGAQLAAAVVERPTAVPLTPSTTRPATKVLTTTDLRRLMDSKEIDAISTATPNHWHALITIWACQAGKDVYCEKPVSHNVWEGRQAVEAARKYDRIVQAGTQSRSNPALKAAYEWVQKGGLGKIQVVRGLCYKRRASIGDTAGAQKVPETVDYNMWLGPAKYHLPRRKQFHYDWHWQWAYGNGDLGNQGIHQMDTARWALGKQELSPRVFSVGGRFGYEDDGETPNTQFVVHDYGDAMLIFEVRGLPKETGSGAMDKYRRQSVGTVVECEGGYLTDSGYGSDPVAYDNDDKQVKKFKAKPEPVEGEAAADAGGANTGDQEGGDHFGNFIKAVRSHKREDLKADILEGHLSSALCHTGNISYRLGRPTPADQIANVLKDQKPALETYERFQQHLAANDVDLKDEEVTLGAFLVMDPRTERFVNNDQANEMLTRQYRAPFVVPAKV